ncbi:sulfotransferase family 2 domain-containing protein [Oxynema aestuarii]|uniref:Sulfotransferase family 2 domain-containing protein n=1 Tax=Oxynema aestuarii AP17 TaxID=2064643 RepID=A0A6H1U0U9_9CYAN|nr:sulfotransferase family 2 domain-containing protein [Oxynema aestuarii]QIZ72498.1 sulfotransferase family 2 domain-containing protein [Oxynema aestuarii AP17]
MNYKQEKTLFFLHIPKAAGTTLNDIITRQYKSESVFQTNPVNIRESKNKLIKMSESDKENFKVIKGHMEFGWHEFIPQEFTYITMLRDPVERVISLYYYILKNPRHYLYNIVTENRMSLRDLLSSRISAQLSNGQTRILSGREELVQKPLAVFEECPAEWLDSAKQNLDKYFVTFGLTEKFDESLILFKQILGWKIPFYTSKNVNKHRLFKSEFSVQDIILIEEYNRLDIELYKYAKKLFEEQIYRQQSAIKTDLRRFRQFNQVYRVYAKFSNYSRSAKNKVKSIIKDCV